MSKKSQSVRKNDRHRYLIITTIVCLITIVVLIGLSFYSVKKVQQSENQLLGLVETRNATNRVASDIIDTRISYHTGDNLHRQHLSELIPKLTQISHYLNILSTGGEMDIHGKSSVLPSIVIDEKSKGYLVKIYIEISKLTDDIKQYSTQVATSDSDSRYTLEKAIGRARPSNKKLFESLDLLVASVASQKSLHTRLIDIYQLLGGVVAILYLAAFLLFFMRRLKTVGFQEEKATLEMQEIMATVSEGLFLIDADMKISGQYSACLESLIGQKDLANRRLDDVLKPIISQKNLEITRDFIEQLFNDRAKEKLIQDLNPLDKIAIQIINENNVFDNRYLSFSFSRIYENKKIKRILVGVNDITKAVLLEQQLNQQEQQSSQQIELLTSVMYADPQMLNTFISHAHNATERINEILKRSENEQTDLFLKTKDIFREIHSLKGEASALELNEFVALTHSLENNIEELQQQPELSGNAFLPLTVGLEQLIMLLNRVDKLVKRMSNLPTTLFSADHPLKQGEGNEEDLFVKSSDEDALTNYFRKYAGNIAQRNGKLVELRTSGLSDLEKDTYFSDNLTDIIIQLLRNGIVHGIETPERRSELGKNETGIIQISFTRSEKNHRAELMVADNGSGIQFSNIRKKIVKIGLCDVATAKSLSKQQLVALLFDSGFSTIAQVSEDAGRGVGLDIIKERVENKLGGTVHVDTKPGHHTRFIIYLPLPKGA